MRKPIDLTGRRFGRLVAQNMREPFCAPIYWSCVCDCGKQHVVLAASLRGGKIRSCGCLRDEKVAARSTTHGHTKDGVRSREYDSWSSARERCRPEASEKFPNYAGRGIRMCERWTSSFQNFIDDMGPCPPDFTLERNNGDGNYEPENCRWVSRFDQARNRRTNVFVEWNGASMVLKDVAILEGVSYRKLHHEFREKKLSLEEAVSRARLVRKK